MSLIQNDSPLFDLTHGIFVEQRVWLGQVSAELQATDLAYARLRHVLTELGAFVAHDSDARTALGIEAIARTLLVLDQLKRVETAFASLPATARAPITNPQKAGFQRFEMTRLVLAEQMKSVNTVLAAYDGPVSYDPDTVESRRPLTHATLTWLFSPAPTGKIYPMGMEIGSFAMSVDLDVDPDDAMPLDRPVDYVRLRAGNGTEIDISSIYRVLESPVAAVEQWLTETAEDGFAPLSPLVPSFSRAGQHAIS